MANLLFVIIIQLLLLSHTYCQTLENNFYSVTRVHFSVRMNSSTNQIDTIQTWSKMCQQTLPTLLHFSKPTETSQNPPLEVATCEDMYISVWSILQNVSNSCTEIQCQQMEEETIGGYSMRNVSQTEQFIPNALSVAPPQQREYVSISTYLPSIILTTAVQSQHGNTSSALLNYCPGTSSVTSSFIFKSGMCITAPKLSTNYSSSLQLFQQFKAFYAICGSNQDIMIHGCEDEQCNTCWLLSNSIGCIAMFSDTIVNVQGCGLGRAAMNSTIE